MKPLNSFILLACCLATAPTLRALEPKGRNEFLPLCSLLRDSETGQWSDAKGRALRVVATNEDYNFALVVAGTEAAPNVDFLEPPRLSTPRTDMIRASQGEGTSSPSFEVQLEPNVLNRAFHADFRGEAEKPGTPAWTEVAADPVIALHRLLPEQTRRILPKRADAGKSVPASPTPVVAEAAEAAEAAAGFPGEVIEEVIVPVPSEIFMVMDKLGRPDWRAELRKSKTPTFSNRVDVALLLGSVVAEGFVAVQAEDKDAVERIGKDVLRLSESLGLKETVLPHTNSILEASKNNHWEIVRVELDKTQKTVRDTMEQRRDAELGQCVSLGGWLRGTDAVTSLITKNYTSDAAELLNQPDIIRHFQKELKKLATRNSKLKAMLDGLTTIADIIGTGDEAPNAAGVKTIHDTADRLVKSITTSASSAH